MWFVLGIVSLISLTAYWLYRKLVWSWGWRDDRGEFRALGKPYKHRHSADKHGRNHSFRFGVVFAGGPNFRIKREGRWDRIAKQIGLSVEQTFRDADFDEDFYVVSDDPELARELANEPAIREVIKALFRDPNLRRLECEGQHLVAEYRVRTSGSAPQQYRSASNKQRIVGALYAVAGALSHLQGGHRRDPYAWRAALMVSLASAVLFLGLGEILRLAKFEHHDPLLESWPLIRHSLLTAALALVAWLAAAAAWLRGSSHAHVVVAEILLSGGIGLATGSYALMRDLNCEWDTAPARVVAVEVLSKQRKHHRKAPDTYTITIRADAAAMLPERLNIGHADYLRLKPGGRAEVHVRPGRLGHAWVSAVQPAAGAW